MALKLPIDPKRAFLELRKARDLALASARDPRGTTEKVVEQTRGAVTLGRHLVEGVAGQVREQVGKRRGVSRPGEAPRVETPPPVAEPAAEKTPAKKTPAEKTPAKKAAAKQTPSPADVAKKAPAKKTPATKAAATKKATKKATTKATTKAEEVPAATVASAPGDKLPPRAATKQAPPSPPREVEPNPEAGPPRGEG